MKVKLWTHTDLDGVSCAVLAYLAFGQDNVDVEYCDYKDVDEKVGTFWLEGPVDEYDHIYVTDISVSTNTAKIMQDNAPINMCDKIHLFDHHATALDLNDYEWANVRVKDKGGVKTSGTMMFYRYLKNEGYFDDESYHTVICENVERFAEIVRDYDTWRWKEELGNEGLICKQLNDLFHMYGRDRFIEWAISRVRYCYYKFPYFDEADAALLENKQKDIDIYISIKDKQLMTIKDNFGYTCGVVFAERYFSELGNKLSELHPELDYIAMIDISHGGVSYRTIKDDIDLGQEIVHSFGGGGHRKAAGSSFDGEAMRGLVLDRVFGLENGIAL